FAASDASRTTHRIVEVEHDLLKMTAPGHADDIVDLHLAAGADAEIALDAGVEIDRHRRVAAVGRRQRLAPGEATRGDVLALDDLPELAVRIVGVRLVRLVGEQELGDHAARGLCTIGVGLDPHAGGWRADAARGQHALALDLDHADAAID